MGIKRRRFMAWVGAGTAVFFAAFLRLSERIVPATYTEALRTRVYPGPRKTLDDAEIRRPGRWGG